MQVIQTRNHTVIRTDGPSKFNIVAVCEGYPSLEISIAGSRTPLSGIRAWEAVWERLWDLGGLRERCNLFVVWKQTAEIFNRNPFFRLANDYAQTIKELETEGYPIKAVLLCGKHPADAFLQGAGGFPSGAFFQIYKAFDRPAAVTYNPAPLSDARYGYNQSALLGHVVKTIDMLVTGKVYRIETDVPDAVYVDSVRKFKDMLAALQDARALAVDTETTNLQRINNPVLTIQFAIGKPGKEQAWFLPWRHPETPWGARELERMRNRLREFFERHNGLHIGANLQFDVTRLTLELGLRYYAARLWDVQGGAWALDENRRYREDIYHHPVPPYALEQLVLEYGCRGYAEGDIAKSDRARMSEIPLSRIVEYGVKDVVYPLRIYYQQLQQMRDTPGHQGAARFVRNQISNTLHAFSVMEINGMLVDKNYLLKETLPSGNLRTIIRRLQANLENLPQARKAVSIWMQQQGKGQSDLFGNTGRFSVRDRKHLQALFFDVLQLPAVKTLKDGTGSLDKNFKALNGDHPIVKQFMEYEQAYKLYTTYIVGFLKKLASDPDMKDGRLRTRAKYLKVVTGRVSMEKPSLQQIPSRMELAKTVKRQFIAEPNCLFIEMDYSAHEVNNWAFASGDAALAKSFLVGHRKRIEYRLLPKLSPAEREEWAKVFKAADLHRQNCKRFFGTDPLAVTDEERSKVKAVVFGTLYDLHPRTLAKRLNIDEDAAMSLVDTMFSEFPDGKRYIDDKHADVEELCRVVNPIGMVRHLWMNLSADHWTQLKARRKGPNSCIQGVSSQEGFQGHRNMHLLQWQFDRLKKPLGCKLINSVHDSVYSMGRIAHFPIVLYCMEHAFTTMVHVAFERLYGCKWLSPLQVEFKIGGALSETKTWDYRYDHLVKMVQAGVEWCQAHLGYTCPNKEWAAFEHNLSIIRDIRRKELLLKEDVPKTVLLLGHVRDYDWQI